MKNCIIHISKFKIIQLYNIMEREIVLSSYSVKNKDNNKPENFVTEFVRPIILDSNHEYMIGLNRIINMSFTWFNINAQHIREATVIRK